MNQILGIVGPTASGKTALATSLSHLIPSTLISADSRQVYRDMDIVTGKDHPAGVTLYGIDLIDPSDDFSVSNWFRAVKKIIAESHNQNKLPIVIGGTGLYFRQLIHPIATIDIPINPPLRQSLTKLSVPLLQNKLKKLDLDRFLRMNHSDINNPRRLIRAIEVATFSTNSKPTSHTYDVKLIGLSYQDLSYHSSLIRSRVLKRLQEGAIQETQKLLRRYGPNLPSLTAIGYRSIMRYLAKEITENEMIETWTRDEISYAKRQMLFFRKIPNIKWFEGSSKNLIVQVEKELNNWYDITRQ